jgi:hypothetical protein
MIRADSDGPEISPRTQESLVMAKKTTCPVSRGEFLTKARAVPISIGDMPPLLAEVKEFSTGSLGWYLNGKTTIDVGGTRVSVQIGLNLTVVGSKELPREEAVAAAAQSGADDE